MLTATRLTDQNTLEIAKINSLYDSAFPAYEQRRHQGRKKILRCEEYHLYAFADNDHFVGFIGSWKIADFFYIEHLAILPTLRGQGYGQQILTLFSEQVQKIILEIDPVIDEVSQKRLRFYQHCGFQQNNYPHEHPSYHPQYAPHQLTVLSFPAPITPQIYQQFNQQLTSLVMKPTLL